MTSAQAETQLKKFGPNILPEKPLPSDLVIFFSQLKNPLVYILVVAGFVTLLLQHTTDAVIIFIAILVNTTLGFFQERKAGRALSALKKLIHPQAKVVRGGKIAEIDTQSVVPADLVILGQGDKVPADGELVSANRLFLTEAILTGESVPIEKKKKDRVFTGTIVLSGQGKFLVEATGAETEVGKIAKSVQEPSEDTPLRKQLVSYSRSLSILVFALTIFVFLVGFVSGREALEVFTTAVALAVSAIPEGLLVALTAVLAIGMRRILKRRGLVRNLLSAETLGGVTTICVDKTGTLTQGRLQVETFDGEEKDLVEQAIIANDLDDPLVIAAWDWALEKLKTPASPAGRQNSKLKAEELKKKYKRFDSIPFSSEERFFACLNQWNEESNVILINGAPDDLIKWTDLDKAKKESVRKKIDELTKEGKRLVGMARKYVPSSKKSLSTNDVKSGLEWVGVLAFSDPVRSGVREALEKTRSAGVSLMVITGDYPETAVSVMKRLKLEIDKKNIILGKELEKISSGVLKERLLGAAGTVLFARTTPQQKLKIVQALKDAGEVVAMTGDGVNDAPALNHADIGIVVGEATDVAKETADLVLLDSSFATIVAAIEEGRAIFDNIRKIILYLMSDAFEEILAVVGTILLGLPLPVTAAQILWINLVSDGFPDLALTVDPKSEGIMERSPRAPTEKLVAPWIKSLILIVSVTGGLVALAVFEVFYKVTANLVLSRSIAFATLGVNSLVYVFSVRTLKKPFWEENIFANKWLILAVIGGAILQLTPFLFETTRKFFNLMPLSIFQWVIVFTTSVVMFIIIEVAKYAFRHRLTA